MSENMRPFCAVCLTYIVGRVRREAIDGVEYIVCARCSSETPTVAHATFKIAAEYSFSPGAILQRQLRADRERRGVCIYSDNHGPATHGRVCKACSERSRKRGSGKPRQPPTPKHIAQKNRRERNKQLGRCINHPLLPNKPPHSPPVNGSIRCQACTDIHARSR